MENHFSRTQERTEMTDNLLRNCPFCYGFPSKEDFNHWLEQYVIKARIDQVKNHIHFENFDNQQDWNNDCIAEIKKGLK